MYNCYLKKNKTNISISKMVSSSRISPRICYNDRLMQSCLRIPQSEQENTVLEDFMRYDNRSIIDI